MLRYTLQHGGHALAVEHDDGEWVLTRDGEEVGREKTTLVTQFEDPQVHITAFRGRVRSVELIEDKARFAFDGPPGSTQARRYALQRSRPLLYALRHPLFAALRVAVTVAGLGAIIAHLVDWLFDHIHIPTPDIDLPSIPWPDIDLPDLPAIHLPGWLEEILATTRYWWPIVLALFIAYREVKKHRARTREPTPRESPTTGAPGAGRGTPDPR